MWVCSTRRRFGRISGVGNEMSISRRTVLQGGLALSVVGSTCYPESDEDNMNNNLDNSYPTVLRSSSEITANSDSEVSAGPLVNSSGEAVEIHEFIFSVRPTDSAIANYGSSGLFPSGGQFALGLSVKDSSDFGYSLTNGVIPLWNFGQARQLGEEEKVQSFQPDFNGNYLINGFLTSVYSWKLDYPMYLPPGARIVPVSRPLGSFNGDVVLGVTAIGKILPNRPVAAAYKIPWVCAAISKSFSFSEQGTDSSNDNALYNPFTDTNVVIERFIGRFLISKNVTVETTPASTQLTVFDTTFLDASRALTATMAYSGNNLFSQLFSIQMRDSIGNPLVREKTLFRNVFEAQTRSWETRQVLPPRQYHKVDFFKASTELPWTTPGRIQGAVSSVGWREVSWRKA